MKFYVYVYLDPRKPGKYVYGEYKFDYEPFYVGKGSNDRSHRIHSHYGKYTQYKINKIEKSGFIPIIIKQYNLISENDAFIFESKMINDIGRSDKKSGPLCNHTNGGGGITGYKHTDETKEKIRITSLGRKHTEKTKKRLSILNKLITGEKTSMYGKHHTEETKEKIRNSNIGKCRSDSFKYKNAIAHRKSYFIKTPDGNTIKVNNLPEFCIIHNVNKGNMSSMLNGKRKSCGGYTQGDNKL